jgi:predicted ATP-grasp superfamily ATP-dependent carboligase
MNASVADWTGKSLPESGTLMPRMAHAVVVRGELNGLGVIRSLARGGIPTVLVETTRLRAGAWSRFCRVKMVERLYGPGFVEDLLDLQREIGGRPVLILTDEMAVMTVSEHRDRLAGAFRFELPSHDMVTRLSDKALFQQFAEEQDLPVPRAASLRRDSDLAELSRLRFPVIVKPADKKPVYLGETERLHTIADLAQCEALCRRLLSTVGEIVVQEWIDGPDSNIFFSLFHRGRDSQSLTIFSGQKLVCNPPKTGSTAFCIAAPAVAAQLEALTTAYIELSAYRGLGSVEFKYDQVNQRFIIIEPTVGRTDWQEEIATLSGINIPLAAYRYEMGLPPAGPVDPKRPVAWQESLAHWKGRAALPGPMRVYDGYWRLRDPLPALVHYVNAIVKRLKRNDAGRRSALRLAAAAAQRAATRSNSKRLARITHDER